MNTFGLKDTVDAAEDAMKLLCAFGEGQRAGQLHLSTALNPHPLGSPEHAEWERGRSTTIQEAT